MSNNFPSWQDWQDMSDDQRQYAIWSVLHNLQAEKKVDRIVQFFGAFTGAVVTLGVLASISRYFI